MNDREYQKLKGNKILKRAGVVIRSITYRTLDGVLYFDDKPVFKGKIEFRNAKVM